MVTDSGQIVVREQWDHPYNSAHNKASGLTGHLVAIFLTQGLLVHFCLNK